MGTSRTFSTSNAHVWDTLTLSNEQYSLNTTKIIENIDTESEYNFKAVATDYFSTSEYLHNLSTAFTLMDFNTTGKGVAIGKVSTRNAFEVNMDTRFTGDITINEKSFLDLIYPIGAIYMSVDSTDPGELFGGTWTSWGAGCVPVGINTSDGDFSTVEKTGGNKSHIHTLWSAAAMIGSDNGLANSLAFSARNIGDMGGTSYSLTAGNISPAQTRSHNTALTGTTDGSSNLPPYITCYMWKRTA